MSLGTIQGVRDGLLEDKPLLAPSLARQIVGDPEIQTAVQELSRAAAAGALAPLGDLDLSNLDEQTEKLVEVVLSTAERRLPTILAGSLEPAADRIEQMAAVAVRRGLRTFFEELNRGNQTEKQVERLVTVATSALFTELDAMARKDLAETLNLVIEQSLLPAGRTLSRQIAKEAVLGVRDGLEVTWDGKLLGLANLGNATPYRVWFFVAVGGAIFLGILVIIAMWSRGRAQKTLTILSQEVEKLDDDKLKLSIKNATNNNHCGPWFSSFLKKRGI